MFRWEFTSFENTIWLCLDLCQTYDILMVLRRFRVAGSGCSWTIVIHGLFRSERSWERRSEEAGAFFFYLEVYWEVGWTFIQSPFRIAVHASCSIFFVKLSSVYYSYFSKNSYYFSKYLKNWRTFRLILDKLENITVSPLICSPNGLLFRLKVPHNEYWWSRLDCGV